MPYFFTASSGPEPSASRAPRRLRSAAGPSSYGRKLYLFGSGRYAQRFLEKYGDRYPVEGYLDNDVQIPVRGKPVPVKQFLPRKNAVQLVIEFVDEFNGAQHGRRTTRTVTGGRRRRAAQRKRGRRSGGF